MTPHPDPRKALRKQLRAMRRALTRAQQRDASKQLARQLSSHPVFLRSARIAFYMAEDGEIDVMPLLEEAIERKKHCYLPMLHPLQRGALWFGRYQKNDRLIANRFGLAEPDSTRHLVQPWSLDLVLLPLVGFDRAGHRLGMGGGFYDRSFAFRHPASTHLSRTPILIGVAHHAQEVKALDHQPWDVTLDYLATDKEIITAKKLGC